jgi:mannose/fructose/N-acetylgalactosamine-specific phosphotransferase system component IIC
MKPLEDHLKNLWKKLPEWLQLTLLGASGLIASAVFTVLIIALAGEQNYLGIIAVGLAFAMIASVFLVAIKSFGGRKGK